MACARSAFSCSPANPRRPTTHSTKPGANSTTSSEPAVPELVKTLAELDWMHASAHGRLVAVVRDQVTRCRGRICQLEMQLLEAEAHNDLKRIEFLERRLINAYRYKTAAENSFQRALRALEKFRAVRKQEQVSETRINVRRSNRLRLAYKRARLGMPVPERIDDGQNPPQHP